MSHESRIAELIAKHQQSWERLARELIADGQALERERIQRLLHPDMKPANMAKLSMPEIRPARAPATTGRAPPGTVRPLVQQVLADEQGISKAEIGRRVAALNPSIPPSSVTNELQRNEAVKRNRTWLYKRRRGLWYLYEEGLPAETEGPAVTVGDRPAGSTLNGSHNDEATMT